jgi:hypothetical protein
MLADKFGFHRRSHPIGSGRGLLLVLFALGLTACTRCGDKPVDPRAHIHRSSEAVFEVTDIGFLAKRQTQLLALTEGIVTPAQFDGLKSEVTRWLGFDPTDQAKLKEAGLATKGKVVASFGERGRDLLWIVPVTDEAKFHKTVRTLIETRRRVDATRVQKTPAAKLTIYSTSWGTESLPVAAVAVTKGLGFVGLGPKSPKLVEDAIALKAQNSILQHPEYQALDKALGARSLARLLVPTATLSASQALVGQATALIPDEKLIQVIKSLGWTLGWENRQITIQSRFRMNKETIQEIQAVLKPSTPRPKVLDGIETESSVLTVHATGNPQKAIEMLKHPDAPLRKEYDQLAGMVRAQLGLDLDKDVLGLLTGHAAVSARLIDLSTVTNLQAIMQNPAGLARYSVGLGTKGQEWKKRFDAVMLNFEPQLQSKGLERVSKKESGFDVDTVNFNGQMIMESYIAPKAWIVSNDDKQFSALKRKTSDSRTKSLSSLGGIQATLNIVPLKQALEKIDVGRLSGSGLGGPMVRAVLAKALQVLSRFEKLETKIEGVPDGMAFKAALTLAPTNDKK